MEMLMWPTNTTALEAFQFRSEKCSSLGTTFGFLLLVEEEFRSNDILMESQLF